MDGGVVGIADPAQARQRRPREVTITASSLLLLMALAAAAFGQGAFFSAMQWFVVALIVLALALALAARALPVADLGSGFVLAGLLLAIWALLRAAAAGTPASGLGWVLFGAGTAAIVSVSRRLGASSHETLLGGALALGIAVAATGWLGVALHERPWGLPSQGLWRAASTLTYANATAALLVPLALVALARLTAAPRSAYLSLAATSLLTGAGATLSRAGAAAFAAGLLAACWLLGARVLARAAAPVAGAGVALLGLVPSLRTTAPARPLIAAIALASGLVLAVLLQRATGPALTLPIAGAALVAAVFVIYRAPEVHGAIRALTHARFTLASSARSGEATAALHIIERHPLAGVGPGHATLRWTGPGGSLSVDRYSHNEYLQVLTDLGIAGAALAAIFMATAGRLLWRARADLPERATWAGAVAAATAFLLHSGFDFLWQVPAIPLTVGAIVGLAVHQPPGRRHEPLTEPLNERTNWNAASHED
jgi:O-antigen ligase/polysaccharide polymerase Wzy-like membrane protein